MSKFGDAVVISLNHRLNVLGYLDVSSLSEKYRNSANAGTEDMVAALRWIRDNIANFGGDPNNVTLFGQSGGGAKIWTLMQTPSAFGLFHKGIIQSGVFDLLPMQGNNGEAICRALLQELGIPQGEGERLADVPYAQLAEAYKKVAPAVQKKGEYVGLISPDSMMLRRAFPGASKWRWPTTSSSVLGRIRSANGAATAAPPFRDIVCVLYFREGFL